MAEARLELLRNPRDFVDRMAKGQEEIDRFNAEDRTPPRVELVARAYTAAREQGKFLTAAQRLSIERMGAAGIPREFNLPPIHNPEQFPIIPPDFRKSFSWYEELHGRVHVHIGSATCTEVDLDDVSPTAIVPNHIVRLSGTCFEDTPGAVVLKIGPTDLTFANIVELQIYSWSNTQIEAYLDAGFGGFARADSQMWVRTLGNSPSNALPVTFVPREVLWVGEWIKDVQGGFFGASVDGVFLDGRVLGNSAISVERTEVHHSGHGHSELVSPMASGQSLAQGFHIGVDAGRSARMRLTYRLLGPAGVEPPVVNELGPWGLFGFTG